MLCKLLKCGLRAPLLRCALSITFLLNSFLLFAETPTIGIRGSVLGLEGTSVTAQAIRSDGRYLFFSSGASWNVLDLLDMVRVGKPVSVDESVVDLTLLNDTSLIVTTLKGVQSFDVSFPFKAQEITPKFSRPTNAATTVMAACTYSDNGKTFLLEKGSGAGSHLIRVVQDKKEISTVSWSTVFPSNASVVTPNDIRCAKDLVLVFGSGSEAQFFVSAVEVSALSSKEVVNFSKGLTGFSLQDYLLSESGQRLLLLYNRAVPLGGTDDSRLLFASVSSLSNITSLSVGSVGRALTSFKVGDQIMEGVFVAKDTLLDATNPPLEKLLYVEQSQLGKVEAFIRGQGNAVVGTKFPSRWLSTKSDHYIYGFSMASGVVLLSDALTFVFTDVKNNQILTSTQPLKFTVQSVTVQSVTGQSVTGQSGEALDYEIRIDEESPTEGTKLGLSTTLGKSIRSGTLKENTAEAIEVSAAQLGISREGEHSLLIFGRQGSRSVARLGLRFSFDPPPAAVKNFRLGFGNNSVHAFFDPVLISGDLSHFLIYFSYTRADLDNLEGQSRAVATGFGSGLTSPQRVNVSSLDGSMVLAPVPNDQELFVRVQVVDKTGQMSVNNPEALGIIPRRTRSVVEALGSTDSCMLHVSNFKSGFLFFLWLFICCLSLCLGRQIFKSASKKG